MMNRTRIGIALLILSQGLVGCGEHGSPSAPPPTAPSVQQPSPQVLNPTRSSRPPRPWHLMKVLRAGVHGQLSPVLASNQAPR